MLRINKWLALLAFGIVVSHLGACSVGPDYVKPPVEMPMAYKEVAGWKAAEPNDAALREKWWELFDDRTLSGLEAQVAVSNQNIIAAEASFRQARALTAATRSGFYPTVSVGPAVSHSQSSANAGRGGGGVQTDFVLPANLSWEIDVWGRIRRSVEASRADFEASAADLAAVRLSVQAEVATDYFQLRTLDAQKRYLDETLAYFTRTLELTRNRYNAGIVSKADVLQAETQLKSTQAVRIDLDIQRAQLEHAIALLVGRPPSSFSIPFSPLDSIPPTIPLSLPSELLERRPDIASAERHMAAANARIGVARAAYYPTVRLSASIGFEASDLAKLLLWPSRFWSLGPSLSETLFDGGLRAAQNEQALAAYDGSVANYRQTVLTAFREVEDNLVALRVLADEGRVQDEAVEAARQTVVTTQNQYTAGIVSYLNVITAQTAELNNRRSAIAVMGRRMTSAVLLVKALGGGWKGVSAEQVSLPKR